MVNQDMVDASVSHQIGIQRYTNGVVRRMIALLNKADAEIADKLLAQLRLAPKDPSVKRLEQLLASVRKLNSQAYAEVESALVKELKDLTEYELTYQQAMFENVVPVKLTYTSVPAGQVYAAATAKPFQGRLLKEWFSGLEEQQAIVIRDAVRMGFVEGNSITQIVDRIVGTKAFNLADGEFEKMRRGMEAVTRTAINHIGDHARQAFYQANDDLIKGKRYTATLDARTTEICASRDGNIYPMKGGPALPAHFNCRSLYVPVLKSWRELGIDEDELSPSTRASMDGQVPGKTTYQSWLKTQSVERQNTVLGVTKARLFRNGGLELDRFVNDKGHVYTLDELRIKDAAAFKKAGI